MKQLQKFIGQLSDLGIDKAYSKGLLPEWVDAYPPSTNEELIQIKLYLASALNLDTASVLNDQPSFANQNVRYKRTKNQLGSDLAPATALFSAVAKQCIQATATPFDGLPKDPEELRAELVAGQNAVTLERVLEFLWGHGVPVIHCGNLPQKMSRPDALVVTVGGRPCVIVGGKRLPSAWHLFYVTHEVGHIARGHLAEDGILVDDVLSDAVDLDKDRDEQEANSYAFVLLTGSGQVTYLPDEVSDPGKLLRLAIKFGKEQAVDAGHLLLRYAAKNDAWGVIGNLLKSQASGPDVINKLAEEHLNWSALAPENEAIVRRSMKA